MTEPRADVGVNGVVPVLSISRSEEDHEQLDRLLNGSESNWRVVKAESVDSALGLIEDHWFPIVICEHDMPAGSWKAVLERAKSGAAPFAVIVTSRSADERLWAEALNLGAYDVLAKPFEQREVYQVVDSAWRHATHFGVKPSAATPDRSKALVAARIRAFAASCMT